MTDDPARWPHERYRKPRPSTPLNVRAGRIRRAIGRLLGRRGDVPATPRILVVEDDRATRQALGSLFSRRGCAVDLAGSVAEGLARLDPAPDCLVLDLMLPDGDGSAILEAARSSGLRTRVVVTTGVADPSRLDAVARLGPDSLLQKPVTLDDLFRACRVAS